MHKQSPCRLMLRILKVHFVLHDAGGLVDCSRKVCNKFCSHYSNASTNTYKFDMLHTLQHVCQQPVSSMDSLDMHIIALHLGSATSKRFKLSIIIAALISSNDVF